MFWDIQDHFITAQKLMQNEVASNFFATNAPDPKLIFWGVSERFVIAPMSIQN
jgi:hypothetical protein